MYVLMHSPEVAMLCLGVVAREYDLELTLEVVGLICTPYHACGLGLFISYQCCLIMALVSVTVQQHVPIAGCLLGVTSDCVPLRLVCLL